MRRSREALLAKEATELRSLLLERLVVLVVRLRRNCGADGGAMESWNGNVMWVYQDTCARAVRILGTVSTRVAS